MKNNRNETLLFAVPNDTNEIIRNNINKIDNFMLKLNKYASFKSSDQNDSDKRKQNDSYKRKDDEYKIDNKDLKLLSKERFDYVIKFVNKQKYIIEKYKSSGYDVCEYNFKPFKQIIIGLGQESVRELSITLHWIYGIPYIPGQSIKGSVSNWIISEMGENIKQDHNFTEIFGDQDRRGNVIFLDSYPKDSNFNLKLDIFNPHYHDYYQAEKTPTTPPTDWQDPVPIFFLTVEKAIFNVSVIYLKKGIKEMKIANKNLEGWMSESFEYEGIGAKTALGYGTGSLIKQRSGE